MSPAYNNVPLPRNPTGGPDCYLLCGSGLEPLGNRTPRLLAALSGAGGAAFCRRLRGCYE